MTKTQLIDKFKIFKGVNGYENIYLAGGAVRDFLLKQPVKDYILWRVKKQRKA